MIGHWVNPMNGVRLLPWARTCVIGIALVLQMERPGPVGVLVPEVCGHEGPVPVALLAGVKRTGGEERGAGSDRPGAGGEGCSPRRP